MRPLEIALWTLGLSLILLFLGTHAWSEIERKRDIAAFAGTLEANNALIQIQQSEPQLEESPSKEFYATHPSPDDILAVLRVQALGLELPVRYGTEESLLRRGPGIIEGTALPGSMGNVAIAAHRDTHFRALKDLRLGDLIELESPDGLQLYLVTDLTVVDPYDTHVLDDNGQSVMTLVTCYPFHFVGSAPKRFIVRAEAAVLTH